MEIELAGENLLLSEHKIIYWSRQQTAFIADLHFGKTTHFRKSGIAVPMAIVTAEIDRIENIISKFRPKRVFFLGDLFHSDINNEWTIFNDFLAQHPTIEFVLIKGNHDILNESVYKLSHLKIEEEPYPFSPFILTHHPLKKEVLKEGQVNFCGHIHPGISIKGKGKSYLTLPCFYLQETQMTLPAFGSFTGLAKIKPKKGCKAFAILTESVTIVE